MSEIKVDNWCGHPIRFVEHDGRWYAVLKDVCDTLGITNNRDVRTRIPVIYMEKLPVSDVDNIDVTSDRHSNTVTSRARHTQTMLVVEPRGVYHAFLGSRKLEAQKFVEWMIGMVDKNRVDSGYSEFDVMTFAADRAASINKTDDEIIKEYVDAAWRMRYWEQCKWFIEVFEGVYLTLEDFCKEYAPEELADAIYIAAYKQFGGDV